MSDSKGDNKMCGKNERARVFLTCRFRIAIRRVKFAIRHQRKISLSSCSSFLDRSSFSLLILASSSGQFARLVNPEIVLECSLHWEAVMLAKILHVRSMLDQVWPV